MFETSKEIRKEIIQRCRKHCDKCNGLCCCCAEFTVFEWELNNLPAQGKEQLVFRKQWGSKGKSADIKIERISMGKQCPFLEAQQGCNLVIETRPLDCISYPIYPIVKYSRLGRGEIVGMMVHKSCPYAKEISKDKYLVGMMAALWREELERVIKKDLRDWFGNKRNYWLDKNVYKVDL